MSFSAPSTKRGGKPGRRMTTVRGPAADRASARGSILAQLPVPAAKRVSAWRWSGRTSRRIGRRPLRPSEPPARPEDTPAEIAAELGLAGPLTLDQLAARWRDFVWRNHPDRQPAHARQLANARVAIANTLYDRARRELVERR